MKVEVDKLDVNKLVNATGGLNNLKTRVDDLDVNMLKTVPLDLKKVSNVVNKKVVKNTKFNKLNMKVNNSERKIPNGSV